MPKRRDSQIVKMKRNLRAKMRRRRGNSGATTISGMIQGIKQKSKAGVKKANAKINTGSQINALKNKITGKRNRLLNLGKKRHR